MVISSQQNKYEYATPGSHPRESFTIEPDYLSKTDFLSNQIHMLEGHYHSYFVIPWVGRVIVLDKETHLKCENGLICYMKLLELILIFPHKMKFLTHMFNVILDILYSFYT